MKTSRSPYSRGFIGIPDVAIAALWIVLWMVWPTSSAFRIPDRNRNDTEISFAVSASVDSSRFDEPDAVMRSDMVVSNRLANIGIPDRLTTLVPIPPKILENDGAGKLPDRSHLASPVGLDGYRPGRIERQDVAAFGPDRTMQVTAQVLGELKTRGFTLPRFEFPGGRKSEKPWMSVARVEVGLDGKPQSVFLETATDDPAINAAVMRMVGMGMVTNASAACAGTVVVNFGMP